MKVLHVFKTYYPDTVGGIEQVISQLALSLAARGHESRVYTLSAKPHPRVLRRPEGEVHRSQLTADVASVTLSARALLEFREQVAWADVVHYQYPWPFADVLHFLWARHKPTVLTYQSDIVRQKWGMKAYEPLMHLFLRSVGAVVATSPAYKDSSDVLSRLPRCIEVIPNGIDPATYPRPEAQALEAWRRRVGDDFFLFVGVLRYYKGLHTLVEAAKGFGGRIVIAGAGPETERVQRQVAEAGLDNVVLLGQVSDEDKMSLLQLCRAFVFPSHLRSEAFGISMVEAAMSGKPMICCDIGTGTSYVNAHGETGWVVPPDDSETLRRTMETLLHDPAQARLMGAAARARFERLFTASGMAARYESLYAQVATRGRLEAKPSGLIR